MCGGTHVTNTSEIQGLTVTKIKKVKHQYLYLMVNCTLQGPTPRLINDYYNLF